MQKITPFLWFNDQAEDAATLYTSLFANSKISDIARFSDAAAAASGKPAGSVLTVAFTLAGQEFLALNSGPQFSFSPAVSFFVNCATRAEFDALWAGLAPDGAVLMAPDTYPFSERFGWLEDRFGVSWQLNVAERAQKITPCLLFVGDQHGQAEAAVSLYTGLFGGARIVHIERYGPDAEEPAGTVKQAVFELEGQEFRAMDSGLAHAFTFTPAISFLVNCETQAEVDTFWEALTAGGTPDQCGWLRDRFGVSWQIVPTVLSQLISDPDPARADSVTRAMLQMSKLDIRALQRAYDMA